MFAMFERNAALGPPSIEAFMDGMAARGDRKRLLRAYMHAERSMDVGFYRYDLPLSTGNIRHLLMVAEPIRSDAEAKAGMRWFVQDVTQNTRNEIALKAQSLELAAARDAAKAGARVKTDFLATMSHEIRTPMNGVLGMTTLLVDTPLSPDQQEYVSTIRNSGEALLAIVNDILDFSKIEAGKLDLEDAEFPLYTTIEECMEIVASDAHRKGLELIPPVPSGSISFVRGDQGRVRQIVLNLLSNAIRFTAEGEVAVSVHVQPPATESVLVRFEVRDTGIGIPSAMLSRLFQAFSQADSSTTRRFGGTGLGLAISRRLAEMMGGETGVSSQPGEDSTFWFTARFGIAGQPGEISRQLLGRNILVVDDNTANRRVLQLHLERNGCSVRAVGSAGEALAALSGPSPCLRSFDAVLSDLRMPGTDGLTLAAYIRSIERFRELPVVILTSDLDRNQLRQGAVDAILRKPVRESNSLRCLSRLLALEGSPGTVADGISLTPPARTMDHSSRTGKVLIAEDNLINQKVASILVKKLGYSVQIVSNGKLALEALQLDAYDLVLMDCQMPEMDGFEATKAIRAGSLAAAVPVIALTANAPEGEKEKCLAAGMNDYLAKPINREALARKLCEWIPERKPGSTDAV
jgi:two-component system sensor histidine kinase/response regulator